MSPQDVVQNSSLITALATRVGATARELIERRAEHARFVAAEREARTAVTVAQEAYGEAMQALRVAVLAEHGVTPGEVEW